MTQPQMDVRVVSSGAQLDARIVAFGSNVQITSDQMRALFLHDLLSILGDCRILWLPAASDTTTTTESSKDARVLTYDATIAARLSAQGSGQAVDFDGTDDEADTPDVDALSFGDGASDLPLSVGVLCKPDVNNALMTLLAKASSATVGEEYQLFLDASGHLNFQLQDESSDGTLEGRYAAAVGTSWTLLGASYDGSMAISGMNVYTNGVRRALTDDSAGTYTAMENGAALLHLGARYTTKAQFFNGKMVLAFITAKQLSDNDWWQITKLVNSYFGLSL